MLVFFRRLGQQVANLFGTRPPPVSGGFRYVTQPGLLPPVIMYGFWASSAGEGFDDRAAIGPSLPPTGRGRHSGVDPTFQVKGWSKGVGGVGQGVGPLRFGVLEPGGQAQQSSPAVPRCRRLPGAARIVGVGVRPLVVVHTSAE